MRNRAVLITTLGFVLSLFPVTLSFAQQPNNPALGVALVRLLQGQEINLPEDFVARLDGENLKVALKSMGLSKKYPDRDLLVFLIQEDNKTAELKPDENGEVVFYNVKEGLAAIVIASGQVAYAAMAVYAEKIAPTADQTVSPFEIAVGSVEVSQIRPGVDAAGHAPIGESAKRLTDYPKRAVNRFRVYLQPDGLLPGRVVVPEAGFERSAGKVILSFFRDGVLVARTVSANDGSFSVPGLNPGMHTVFASGPPGHASFPFEVVAPKTTLSPVVRTEKGAKQLLVSTQVGALPAAADPVLPEPADELIVLLIPPRIMPEVREVVGRMYPLSLGGAGGLAGPTNPGFGSGLGAFGSPLGGGGFGGGGFGGGGFGGGGGGLGGGLGGLGGLLGAAGLAVGVVALTDDNNNNGINLPVATSISPNAVTQ